MLLPRSNFAGERQTLEALMRIASGDPSRRIGLRSGTVATGFEIPFGAAALSIGLCRTC